MPRMGMQIQNSRLPVVAIKPLANTSYNTRVNVGAQRTGALLNMAFKAPMVDRIAGLKPGCSACGKH